MQVPRLPHRSRLFHLHLFLSREISCSTQIHSIHTHYWPSHLFFVSCCFSLSFFLNSTCRTGPCAISSKTVSWWRFVCYYPILHRRKVPHSKDLWCWRCFTYCSCCEYLLSRGVFLAKERHWEANRFSFSKFFSFYCWECATFCWIFIKKDHSCSKLPWKEMWL